MGGIAQALPELLIDVKNYLDITWDDSETDKKVSELIQSGIVYLQSKIGDVSFADPGLPRSLLLDYVRYMRDGAMDIFEANYMHIILAAKHDAEVKQYAETADATEQ